MSRNRFIWWDGVASNPKDMPDEIYVREEVKDYFEGMNLDIDHDDHLMTITFPSSFWEWGELHQRFIEVVCGDNNVDVITRSMDDFTNAVADGFARRLARKRRGRLDDR